jgi:hypothetical protein
MACFVVASYSIRQAGWGNEKCKPGDVLAWPLGVLLTSWLDLLAAAETNVFKIAQVVASHRAIENTTTSELASSRVLGYM